MEGRNTIGSMSRQNRGRTTPRIAGTNKNHFEKNRVRARDFLHSTR